MLTVMGKLFFVDGADTGVDGRDTGRRGEEGESAVLRWAGGRLDVTGGCDWVGDEVDRGAGGGIGCSGRYVVEGAVV